MTIKQRKEQLRYRKAIVILILVNIICWLPVLAKYKAFGCDELETIPCAGASMYLADLGSYAIEHPTVVEDVVEIVEETPEEEPEIELDCWKKYTAPRFRQLGRVKYGSYTYTFYSEKVLAGGGLKIPDRHLITIDGLNFVADIDNYICVASDDLPKGTIVDTPVGRKGKIYDCGSGKGNLDIYVSW